MDEIIRAFVGGVGIFVCGALLSSGLYTGVMIASHYLGPLRITLNRERIDVYVRQERK